MSPQMEAAIALNIAACADDLDDLIDKLGDRISANSRAGRNSIPEARATAAMWSALYDARVEYGKAHRRLCALETEQIISRLAEEAIEDAA